jgi:predicted kinase
MKQPALYLLLGYPGAGKTTVSRELAKITGAEHIWADRERRTMFDEPTHSQTENAALYAQLNQRTGELLGAGKSVIFDTNFNYYKDREHLRSVARRFGAQTVLIWLTTPKEIAEHRAVHDSEDKDTRVLGSMTHEDFRRIASHLEPPRPDEHPIKIDGTDFDPTTLHEILDTA